jgi:dGTPase
MMMDWADDITYAVHDIEDFFRLGLIPLHNLRTESAEQSEFLRYAFPVVTAAHRAHELDEHSLHRFVSNSFEMFPDRAFGGGASDIAALGTLVSNLIEGFLGGTRIEDGQIEVAPRLLYLSGILKQLTWYYVIDPALAVIQVGQAKVIKEIFQHLVELASSYYLGGFGGGAHTPSRRQLPDRLHYFVAHALGDGESIATYSSTGCVVRGVVDFIASLTDRGAYDLYARLTGDRSVSVIDPRVST